MLKYVLKKLAFTALVLFGAATISFILLHAIPGDTAQALAGPQASHEDVENLRRAMHLDAPLTTQYVEYIGNLLHGDLGHSYRNNIPVMEIVGSAWPATMKLAASSMLVAILIGLPLGIHAALNRGKLGDTLSMMISFVGVSMPFFWLALLLIMLFCVKLKLLPFYGITGWTSYILPSLTLGSSTAANIARLTRTSMLEILGQDYIRTAKGMPAPISGAHPTWPLHPALRSSSL